MFWARVFPYFLLNLFEPQVRLSKTFKRKGHCRVVGMPALALTKEEQLCYRILPLGILSVWGNRLARLAEQGKCYCYTHTHTCASLSDMPAMHDRLSQLDTSPGFPSHMSQLGFLIHGSSPPDGAQVAQNDGFAASTRGQAHEPQTRFFVSRRLPPAFAFKQHI